MRKQVRLGENWSDRPEDDSVCRFGFDAAVRNYVINPDAIEQEKTTVNLDCKFLRVSIVLDNADENEKSNGEVSDK